MGLDSVLFLTFLHRDVFSGDKEIITRYSVDRLKQLQSEPELSMYMLGLSLDRNNWVLKVYLKELGNADNLYVKFNKTVKGLEDALDKYGFLQSRMLRGEQNELLMHSVDRKVDKMEDVINTYAKKLGVGSDASEVRVYEYNLFGKENQDSTRVLELSDAVDERLFKLYCVKDNEDWFYDVTSRIMGHDNFYEDDLQRCFSYEERNLMVSVIIKNVLLHEKNPDNMKRTIPTSDRLTKRQVKTSMIFPIVTVLHSDKKIYPVLAFLGQEGYSREYGSSLLVCVVNDENFVKDLKPLLDNESDFEVFNEQTKDITSEFYSDVFKMDRLTEIANNHYIINVPLNVSIADVLCKVKHKSDIFSIKHANDYPLAERLTNELDISALERFVKLEYLHEELESLEQLTKVLATNLIK